VTTRRLGCVVYLIRHGRTRLNAEGLLRGHLDVPLDEVGRSQARRLAEMFTHIEVAVTISSPLLRARQTAEAIAAATEAPLETEPQLIDRDYGGWTGTSEAILRQRYSSIDSAPGIEGTDAFRHRILTTIDDCATRFGGKRLVVVAHDAVNRHLLASLVPALGAEPADLPQRAGCWNRLERHLGIWAAPVIDAIPDDGRRP
jgi:glucosyl-3-phosphoglycerate phosphatase